MTAPRRHALHVAAAFFDHHIEETFVYRGERTVTVGGSDGRMALPAPEGSPWLARVQWTAPDQVTVTDAHGRDYLLDATGVLALEEGPVSLRLRLSPQFRHRRAEVLSFVTSLLWFTMVLAATVLSSQWEDVWQYRCVWHPILFDYQHPDCIPPQQSGSGMGMEAVAFLERVLDQDFEGSEQGGVEGGGEADRDQQYRRERPRFDRTSDAYIPAGNEGPKHTDGGAEETAPEPVRVPMPEEIEREEQKQDNDDGAVPLAVDNGTEMVTEPDAEQEDTPDLDLDGQQEDDGVAEAEQDIEMPAEEEEGWGLQDWYDASEQRQDDLETKIMMMVARERLAIDPNDPAALQTLSYYQYLSQDYEGAEKTYDKFIELFPDEPAGYNNKALVYKRQRKYSEEEGLYRIALSLDPQDVTAMNNLAVNLAHQGRYEEALRYMELLEKIDPGDAYADLHRAKIHAEMGNQEQAFFYLDRALQGMAALDTLHHIEFRQDIRVDPSFAELRQTERFRAILWQYYGDDTPLKE